MKIFKKACRERLFLTKMKKLISLKQKDVLLDLIEFSKKEDFLSSIENDLH